MTPPPPASPDRHRLVAAAVAAADAALADRLRGADLAPGTADKRRRLLADYFERIGQYLDQLTDANRPAPAPPPPVDADVARRRDALPPRTRQVLDRLLVGDAEKQVAIALGISKHTVHDHAKVLYRTFDVASRGELLARFVAVPA